MAAPTAYTEIMLKTYLSKVLGAVATVLGWDVGDGNYDEIVNETLLAYGVDTIAEATNMRKLRTLARRELWRAVCAELSTDYDYQKQGESASRSQAFAQAQKMLAMAESDAMRYDAAWEVGVSDVTWNNEDNDPYAPVSENA